MLVIRHYNVGCFKSISLIEENINEEKNGFISNIGCGFRAADSGVRRHASGFSTR